MERQQVQELFGNSGTWRQARVDLSNYAGEDEVMLRFDFSTAGAMNDASLGFVEDWDGDGVVTTYEGFGEFYYTGIQHKPTRNLNNDFEGFYIDDVIIGFAERGELVTAVAGRSVRLPRFGGHHPHGEHGPVRYPEQLTRLLPDGTPPQRGVCVPERSGAERRPVSAAGRRRPDRHERTSGHRLHRRGAGRRRRLPRAICSRSSDATSRCSNSTATGSSPTAISRCRSTPASRITRWPATSATRSTACRTSA